VTLALEGAAGRSLDLRPGARRVVLIPTRGYPVAPLRITTDRADYVGGGTADARFLAVRIPSISYEPKRAK
jgi:hypothetical protein